MTYSPMKKLSIATLLALTFSSFVYSADIARNLRITPESPDTPDSFFELGLAAGGYTGSSLTEEDGQEFNAGLHIAGSYNYNGFFVDINADTSDPITLGYTAFSNKNWSFDAILGLTSDGISPGTDQRFEGISRRDNSAMLGGRLTGYFGKSILQLSIQHDVSDTSNGTNASAIIGRNWQYRNWNFHGLMGLGFNDKKAMDYYFGVSAAEAANTQFTQYQGQSQVNFFSTVGVTYPISENWIYRANLSLSSDFGRNESPLFVKKRDANIGFGTSISYVF